MSAEQKPTGDVQVISAQQEADTDNYLESAKRRSPLYLAWLDIKLLWMNKWYLADALLPLKLPRRLPGTKFNTRLITRDYALTVLLTVLEIPLLLSLAPAFLVLPGWLFVILFVVGNGTVYLLSSTMWSEVLVANSQTELSMDEKTRSSKERWLFINGIATSYAMLQQNCDLISATFKRPVMGIHNRSYGIIGDLIECIIQRSFNYNTTDVRVAYAAVKAMLLDEDVNKVVIIAHSQGGILASMILDRLYARVPIAIMAKLEVYTFGSAAAYFNNPILALSDKQRASLPAHLPQSPTAVLRQSSALLSPNAMEEPNRAVPIIEHYCNEFDIVPRWGVLYHVISGPAANAGTYSGRVFVHEKATGHLFDQHYLEAMFPLWDLGSDDPNIFWNHRVANEYDANILRSRTFPKMSQHAPQANNQAASSSTTSIMTGTDGIAPLTVKTSSKDSFPSEVGNGSLVASTPGSPSPKAWFSTMGKGTANGRRVKDLSRLWRYMGGRTGDEKDD